MNGAQMRRASGKGMRLGAEKSTRGQNRRQKCPARGETKQNKAKQKRAPSLAEGRPLGRRCPESALIEQGEPDFPHTT